ncbi:capsule biosynthesis protein CapF [Candidatus Puniceispirillum sp.]|nr:capsule biosynthesis protein CapF [Candidatus Puniceispirillum sp.]
MKLGITGANGFLGFHARSFCYSLGDKFDLLLISKEILNDPEKLSKAVLGLNGILHLAGVNRGDPERVELLNIEIAEKLVCALKKSKCKINIAYANSVQSSEDTPYGRGKKGAANILRDWADNVNVSFGDFVLPNIFGEFSRPNYNSVVANFISSICQGGKPTVDPHGWVELLHAQNAVEPMILWLSKPMPGFSQQIRLEGIKLSVPGLWRKLAVLANRYLQDGVIPNLSSKLDLDLFNCLKSHFFPDFYPIALVEINEERGQLVEIIKTDQCGQVFVSTTKPGYQRGDHWHLRKNERFSVLQGHALISIRKLFSEKIFRFEIMGGSAEVIDIPTFYTHSIKNIGSGDLQTLFWSSEIYLPENSDTFPEVVE